MHRPQMSDVQVESTPAARALALKLVTEADLLRLKVIARLHARGLPPHIDWSDLLQEAFARMLDGSRQRPDDVPLIAFLAGVMRSLKAEHWRRAHRESRQLPKLLAELLESTDSKGDEACDPSPDPERRLIATQELALIDQLFADDGRALQVILGLADGRSPEEICASYDMLKTDYDSTRKRIRRVLLREGLRLPQP
ncbi:MAG: sigma-70 family RNA polymerase sigma factor [Steroidobacteraceae bacterium]